MSEPYFSLILPVYNVEIYLAHCIDVIMEEKFIDYEIILVNDGSTDKSPEICEMYAKKYSNIEVIHKKNGGLSSARNVGMKSAHGKYVFWIDSDDWIEPGALQKLYQATVGDVADIVKFSYFREPKRMKINSIIPSGSYGVDRIQKELYPMILERTGDAGLSAWCHAYKRSFLLSKKLRFVSEREIGSEDYLFNWQAYLEAENILVLDDCLYHYNLRIGSLSQRYRKELNNQYRKLHTELKDYLIRKDCYMNYKVSYAKSYVSKAIGVCVGNECCKSQEHSLLQGWRASKKMFANAEFQEAVEEYLHETTSIKEKLKVWFMKHRIVLPFMSMILRGRKKRRKDSAEKSGSRDSAS